MNSITPNAQTRSSFVTGLAWTFIVLGALATLVTLMQNIMFSIMIPAGELENAVRNTPANAEIPAFARFMMGNMFLIIRLTLVVSLLSLISAIGLIKRKNWARLIFIGLLILGVIWNLAGIALPYFMFPATGVPDAAPQDSQDNFEHVMKVMTIFMTILSITFAGLFAWLAKKLMSEQVRQEFGVA